MGVAPQILEDSATTPLYAGSRLSSLTATLLLLNCLRTHGASNVMINEIFQILGKSVLPAINSLPISEYGASKLLKLLGLSYDLIHACPRGCMLFRGPDSEHLLRCSKCGEERFRQVGKTQVPTKVLRHFPLIPRLQRMFSTPEQAACMTWYVNNRSTDGMVRHVADSAQWKFVDQELGDFGDEARNVRLGLATDGVNPFSIKRSTWSTWPVIMLNYNVPPWYTMKKHFLMLSLIIPGRQAVSGDNFDIYLQPLLEELHILWSEGVQTRDASNFGGSSTFLMRAVLLWTIHDFPAYGIVAGCVTKGYRGCPCCGPETTSRRSAALKKMSTRNLSSVVICRRVTHGDLICPSIEQRSYVANPKP